MFLATWRNAKCLPPFQVAEGILRRDGYVLQVMCQHLLEVHSVWVQTGNGISPLVPFFSSFLSETEAGNGSHSGTVQSVADKKRARSECLWNTSLDLSHLTEFIIYQQLLKHPNTFWNNPHSGTVQHEFWICYEVFVAVSSEQMYRLNELKYRM
jgi:hypothetical protein